MWQLFRGEAHFPLTLTNHKVICYPPMLWLSMESLELGLVFGSMPLFERAGRMFFSIIINDL